MTKEFAGLNKSEIRKAIKLANRINNCNDCVVTGYSYKSIPDEYNTIEVTCEICHGYGGDRADYDVVVEVFMDDRRRSWAHTVIWQGIEYTSTLKMR